MTTATRPAGETEESRIAKALAHPLRARILQLLGERVASPGELAAELGAPLGVVSYHVRMLRDYHCIELVRTEPRRGALQHFYRAIVSSPTVITVAPGSIDLGRIGEAERMILDRVLANAENTAGGMYSARHSSDAERDQAEEELLVAGMLRERLGTAPPISALERARATRQ